MTTFWGCSRFPSESQGLCISEIKQQIRSKDLRLSFDLPRTKTDQVAHFSYLAVTRSYNNIWPNELQVLFKVSQCDVCILVPRLATMIIPIRCFTCGKIVGNKWEAYLRLLQSEYTEGWDEKLSYFASSYPKMYWVTLFHTQKSKLLMLWALQK